MEIEFNTCLHIHEEAFNKGGVDAVTTAIEKCPSRAGGRNFLCAHPRTEGEIGFKSAAMFLKEQVELILENASNGIIINFNIEQFQTMIMFLDDVACALYYNSFRFIDVGIRRMEEESYVDSHFHKSMELGGIMIQEIIKIIKNRNIQDGLNQGEKVRIRFLIGKLQKDIEAQVKKGCEELGIILD